MNDQLTSAKDRKSVVTTVAHTLAHQWFGNLMTLDWWSDLWLSEGFATYFQYVGADHVWFIGVNVS